MPSTDYPEKSVLKRQILGKPLDWLAVYARRYPDAIAGHRAPDS